MFYELVISLKSPIMQRCHMTERNKNTFPWSDLTKVKTRFEFFVSSALCLSVAWVWIPVCLKAVVWMSPSRCLSLCLCVLLCDLCVSVSNKGRTQTFVLFLLNNPGRRLSHFAGNSSRVVKGLSEAPSDRVTNTFVYQPEPMHCCFQPLYLLPAANVPQACSGSRAWKGREFKITAVL